MMRLEETLQNYLDDSDNESDLSTEEIPIWVRGEQRFVSGIVPQTTCEEVIRVLLMDEEAKGRGTGIAEEYQITEKWRGVEQSLEPQSSILDIWNAWSTAQTEIKLSLRRIRNEKTHSRRTKCRSDSSNSGWKTLHPKRLTALNGDKQPSNTEELLKLVLAQGEIIRKQLKKLRHSEHQIGCIEDKTHRARVRKHGSNYLLETYLKGLSEADPNIDSPTGDKNSDSGVVTEGDSEQSHAKNSPETSFERFSPSSEEFAKDLKDDDTSSSVSESTLKEQVLLIKKITKLNKQLLKQEETLVRLDANLKKYERDKITTEECTKSLDSLRTEMTKSSCELQHNEIVFGETMENLDQKRHFLESLHQDLAREDQEHQMLQTILVTNTKPKPYFNNNSSITKELLDTLV